MTVVHYWIYIGDSACAASEAMRRSASHLPSVLSSQLQQNLSFFFFHCPTMDYSVRRSSHSTLSRPYRLSRLAIYLCNVYNAFIYRSLLFDLRVILAQRPC